MVLTVMMDSVEVVISMWLVSSLISGEMFGE